MRSWLGGSKSTTEETWHFDHSNQKIPLLFVCLRVNLMLSGIRTKYFRLRFAADYIKKIGMLRRPNKIHPVKIYFYLTSASVNNYFGIIWLANSQNLKSQTSNNHCQKLPKCWGFQVPHTQLQQQLGFFAHCKYIFSKSQITSLAVECRKRA